MFGPSHPEHLKILHNMGITKTRLMDYAGAEALLEEAARLKEEQEMEAARREFESQTDAEKLELASALV